MYDYNLFRKMGHLIVNHIDENENNKVECKFQFGECWHHTVEYVADDFLAEVGFYSQILGFVPNALDIDYAMFTCIERRFFISFVPSCEERPATPPDSVHLQFLIQDIEKVAKDYVDRGVQFIKMPVAVGTNMLRATFITPGGMIIDLWGNKENDSQ